MANLPLPLKIAILDLDKDTASFLKEVICFKAGISNVACFYSVFETKNALLSDNANAIFIDIFSLGVEEGIEFIDFVRKNVVIVPICLYSMGSDLIEMPSVGDYWKKRFEHYFKLPKDVAATAMGASVDNVLASLSYELQANTARFKLHELQLRLVDPDVFINTSRQEISDIVSKAEIALDANQKRLMSGIVPGIQTQQLEQVIAQTLNEAGRSLQLTRHVNIGVLSFGSLIMLLSFFLSLLTDKWEAVAFGGFGVAGVVAALITNPLKSISASTGRMVQIQTAYFQFLLQLNMLNQAPGSISLLEKSKIIADAMERTIAVLK